ncbi:RusA family crossover junction endodeoxyribonuclease [Xenorhabdus bovienii]|uniref:RusA family crossover junction endodeoxyribonuclease n=1 Tax=Xenorhabdus bovienii TaxID=40576 RepID=UPI0023B31E30|nr:RusA family crossover junction endodeoxyribonuclease [Xenorhabdus bovienii]MDE9545305.1 RusA family crossover junction endodeoxyribonuclease [Xenorhabdus bovienii]
MKTYNLKLPWPPGNNNLYSVFGGRKIKSAKGRQYTELIINQITASNQRYQLSGRLRIEIVANPPDRRSRDLDNLFKAPLDSLTQSGVIADDSLIDDIRMVRGEVVRGGCLNVQIWEMET